MDQKEADERIKAEGITQFKRPVEITEIGRIPLIAMRSELRHKLSQLERHLGMPFER